MNSTHSDVSRCDYIDNINKYCDKEFIFYPENDFDIIKDEPFKPLDTSGSAIQVKPQRVDLKLRPRNCFYLIYRIRVWLVLNVT